MMKIKIVIILLLWYIPVISQASLKVTYRIVPFEGTIENSEKIKRDGMQAAFAGVDAEFKNFEFELLVSKSKSVFKLIDRLPINRRANVIVKGISDGATFYCYDKKAISERELSGKKYFLEAEQQDKWTLHNENKKIGEYDCLRATTTKYRNGTPIYIIAWYCKEIPFSNGPKEYRGLPGLILEVSDDKVTFLAEKIIFNPKKKFEFDLSKQRVYTLDEFHKLALEDFEKSKSMLTK